MRLHSIRYADNADYTKSNATTAVRLERFRHAEYAALLRDGDAKTRQTLAQALVLYLAERFGISAPSVQVVDSNQPHRTGVRPSGRTGLKSWKYGDYAPSSQRIRIFNRTAAKGAVVSIKGFADTLLHEFTHHCDYHVLGLSASPHTAGFYKRIADLKRKLEKTA